MQARSHQDFLALLAEVDAVLAETTQPGAAYLLYTVGGFVMGRGSESRVTQDIDVATTIPDPVSAAAIKVAAQHGMNPAWLNDQVAEMIQATVPVDRFAEIYRGRHLVVYGADDELMLALKLMSGRDRDISDIVDLALRTRRTAPDDLLDVWDRVYGDVPLVAPATPLRQQRHLRRRDARTAPPRHSTRRRTLHRTSTGESVVAVRLAGGVHRCQQPRRINSARRGHMRSVPWRQARLRP